MSKIKQGTQKHKFAALALRWTAILVISFLLAELSLRIYERVTKKVPIGFSLSNRMHERYGWKGSIYGLGDGNTDFNLMVLGDSYTDGERIKPYALYFSTIRAYSGANVFAYGGSGYGTAQEYLVFKDYKDTVKPDLLLLQVTGNDFQDNSSKLARLKKEQLSIFFRPYLINGHIENHTSNRFAWLIMYSRLLYRFQHLLYVYQYNHKDDHPSDPEELAAARAEAIKTTDEIIGKLKEEAGDIPIAAFISYGSDADIRAFKNIFNHYEIPFISIVPAFLITFRVIRTKICRLARERGIGTGPLML